MPKYLFTITRDIEAVSTFGEKDLQTGQEIGVYTVPHTITAGNRQASTKAKALASVNALNTDYGEGTAIYIGKK